MTIFANLLIVFLPWKIKYRLLNKFWKYSIHPQASIGFSYIFPKYLEMKKGSAIGHFNIAIHLNRITLGKNSTIGRSNWITGFPQQTNSPHFAHQLNRKSELLIGNESAITKKHHIDCTNSIIIGDFVTIAGYNSQFLTHSININEGRQDSKPISIGNYCFVSTGVIFLGGSILPSYSVLGAGAVLNKAYCEKFELYAGVPAKPIKKLSTSAKYFNRENGFVI